MDGKFYEYLIIVRKGLQVDYSGGHCLATALARVVLILEGPTTTSSEKREYAPTPSTNTPRADCSCDSDMTLRYVSPRLRHFLKKRM